MKKQIKKLSLNKKTISNLNASEMNGRVGGSYYDNSGCGTLHGGGGDGKTKNGKTCPGHNTCINC